MKYSEDQIVDYLSGHSALDAFYVFCSKSEGVGLIKFVDACGSSWSLMEDDDELVAGAMDFLRRRKAPFFHDIASLLEYEKSKRISGD